MMRRERRAHRELRRKGVTLALLREEYEAAHPEGLQYSGFCEQYRVWASRATFRHPAANARESVAGTERASSPRSR